MSDTSGRSWLAPSAYYDPVECCWKTSGAMFPSDWPTSSQTCPAWGMTRRGELFELPMPALPTAEREFSSLLGTPTSGNKIRSEAYREGRTPNLGELVSLLPTPAVNDMGEGKTVEAWDEWTAKMQARHGPSLAIEAQRLLPTPTARDHKDGSPCANVPTNGLLGREVWSLLPTPTSQAAKHSADDRGPGTADDFNLWSVAPRLMPTPRAQIGEDRNQTCWQRPLDEPQNLENALARSPGAPTRLRSADGSTSPADPPHVQLSLDEAESA